MTAKVADLEREKTTTAEKLDTLMSVITTTSDELVKLKAHQASVQEQHEEALAQQHKLVVSINREKSQLQADKVTLNVKLHQLEQKLEAIALEKDTLSSELEDTKEALTNKGRECNGLVDEVNDLLVIRRELNEELEAVNEEHMLNNAGLFESQTTASWENAEIKDTMDDLKKALHVQLLG